MSENRSDRKLALHLIRLCFPHADDFPDYALDLAVRDVTVDAINLCVTQMLLNEMDEALRDELEALTPFTTSDHPFQTESFRARIYDPTAKALQRQAQRGRPLHTPEVFLAGAYISW
jgi:hypothetical protein